MTSMIATISGEEKNLEESISTCKFAQRVAMVKNDANVNEEVDPNLVIRRLKAEITQLKEEIAFLKGEGDDGGENDLSEEVRLACLYVQCKVCA